MQVLADQESSLASLDPYANSFQPLQASQGRNPRAKHAVITLFLCEPWAYRPILHNAASARREVDNSPDAIRVIMVKNKGTYTTG